jgi:hypothetical protein
LCHRFRSKRWIVDRATLKQARVDDLQYVDDPELLDFLAIYFANGASIAPDFHRTRSRTSVAMYWQPLYFIFIAFDFQSNLVFVYSYIQRVSNSDFVAGNLARSGSVSVVLPILPVHPYGRADYNTTL